MRVGDVRAGVRSECGNSPWVADWSRLLFLLGTSGVLQVFKSQGDNYVRLSSRYLHVPAELAYSRLLHATSPDARIAALSTGASAGPAAPAPAPTRSRRGARRGAREAPGPRGTARAPIFDFGAPPPGFGYAAARPPEAVFFEGGWEDEEQGDGDGYSDGGYADDDGGHTDGGYGDGDGGYINGGYGDGDGGLMDGGYGDGDDGYSDDGYRDGDGGFSNDEYGDAACAPPSLPQLLAAGPLRLCVGGDGRARVLWGVEAQEEVGARGAGEAAGGSGGTDQQGGSSDTGCPDDEASLMQMLPDRLRDHVLSAAGERRRASAMAASPPGGTSASPSTSACSWLVVDVAVDEGRPVQLTFADGTKTRLPAGVQVCIGEALAALHSYARDCARRQQLERRQLLGGHGGGGAGGGARGAKDVEEDLGAQAYERLWKRARLASTVVVEGAAAGGMAAAPVAAADRGADGAEDEGMAAGAEEWHDFQDEVAEADAELFGTPVGGASASAATGAGAGVGAGAGNGMSGRTGSEVAARRGAVGGGDGGGGGGGEGGWALQAARAASAFDSANRCCPPGTLHRISAVREPGSGAVVGLTYRLGRHVPGVAAALADVLSDLAGRGQACRQGRARATGAGGGEQTAAATSLAGSLLLLGRPGAGKTTLLRDIARFLADDLGLSVVVVDTSNEIAGGDAVPHSCIGSARRLKVGRRDQLQAVMLEAVQNHGPQVVVVDELGSRQEAEAARSISQRGVMLVATAHGTDLRSIMGNPDLNSLVGGMQTVILGDTAAGAAHGGAKTRTERRGEPTFRCLVEVHGAGVLRLRPDVAGSVDALLGNDTGISGSFGMAHAAGGGLERGAAAQQPQKHPRAEGRPWGRGGGGVGRGGALPQQLPCGSGHAVQAPGSLMVVYASGAAGGSQGKGGRAGWEAGQEVMLPPMEQLRWTGAAAGGGSGDGGAERGGSRGRQEMCVRLLLPADSCT